MNARWQSLMVPMLMATFSSAQAEDDGCTRTLTPTTSVKLRLVLAWIDAEQVLRDTRGLFEEIERIFESIDVCLEWRIYEGRRAPQGNELFVHLRSGEPGRWQLERQSMGVVFTRGAVERRLYVFFPSLARTLGYKPGELRALLEVGESRQFERALSRVVVHEVVHALAPQLPHAESGITRSRLTRRELLSPQVGVDRTTADVFRRAVAALHSQTAVVVVDARGDETSRNKR